MHLLVGLGNPGSEHARNRHNVGFMCVEEIRRSYGFSAEKSKFSGVFSEGFVDHDKVFLFKPLAYMNRSGRPVAEAARFYKIPTEKIIVFHDDLELIPGKIRVKQGGGHAGHNGLRDLDAHLGKNYWRVRIGVGRPPGQGSASNYVLTNFSKQDHIWLDPLLPSIADEVNLLLEARFDDFTSKIMQALPPPEKKKGKSDGV